MTPWGTRVPVCALCHNAVKQPELHEALITRGMVDGAAFEVAMQIYVPENVVFVHSECHVQIGMESHRHLALWDLLLWNGHARELAYLKYMQSVLTPSTVGPALALLKQIKK